MWENDTSAHKRKIERDGNGGGGDDDVDEKSIERRMNVCSIYGGMNGLYGILDTNEQREKRPAFKSAIFGTVEKMGIL